MATRRRSRRLHVIGGTKPWLKLPKGWRIAVDSNEAAGSHKGYSFDDDVTMPLETGDYSLLNPEGELLNNEIAVDRKSIGDLVGCVTGANRDRWEAVLDRMSSIPSGHVIVEASWRELETGAWGYSNVHPNAVLGSVTSWSLRHNVTFWMAGSWDAGRILTASLLARYAHDREAGEIHKPVGANTVR